MERKVSCFDCVHSKFIPGHSGSLYEPPTMDEAECQNEEVPQELFDADVHDEYYEHFAANCGHFSPIMVGNCGFCRKEVNEPLHSWKLTATEFFSGEGFCVCSEECQDKADAKYKADESHFNARWDDQYEDANQDL